MARKTRKPPDRTRAVGASTAAGVGRATAGGNHADLILSPISLGGEGGGTSRGNYGDLTLGGSRPKPLPLTTDDLDHSLVTDRGETLTVDRGPTQSRKRRRSQRKTYFVLRIQLVTLIRVLEDALEYKSRPRQNSTKPELYTDLELDDPEKASDVRALVNVLRRLDKRLDKATITTKDKPVVTEGKRRLNAFLDRYSDTVATGAGILTIGVVATALHSFGLFDPTVLSPFKFK